MTLKSYLRMLLAAVTLMFVTTGCNDDEEKVGPPPSYTFGIAVSDVTETEATVTVTPSNDQATYYYGAVKKADFDAFESDAAYAQNILATLKAAADRKVLSLEEYLQTALSKGSSPKKIADLTAGTDYYAVAIGMLTDGRFTSDLIKEAFKTGDAPEPAPVISKAGGYFFGTSFGAFDNFTLWMSEDGITENMTDFTGEGTYLIFDLNVTVTGKPTLPAGTFPVASGSDAEENTIAPGADYAGGMMTGSAIVQIDANGTKNYFYIDGGALTIESSGSSYILTAKVTSSGKDYEFKYKGEISIFDATGGGEGPEVHLTMKAGDVNGANKTTSITATVQCSTAVSASYWLSPTATVEENLGKGLTYEDMASPNDKGTNVFSADWIKQTQSADGIPLGYSKCNPGESWTMIVKVTDADGNSTVEHASVTTETGQGGGDGPELTLTLRAGDLQQANKDSKAYMGAYAPTAVGALYGLFETSQVEAAIEKGSTYDTIVTLNGDDMTKEDGWMEYLTTNPGIGVTFNGLKPNTSYTIIVKVTDSAGKSTTKYATASTETAGEPISVEMKNLSHGQMIYYGQAYDNPTLDYADWEVYIADATFDFATGGTGEYMIIELITAKSATTDITPGTYTVAASTNSISNLKAFTCWPGYVGQNAEGNNVMVATWYCNTVTRAQYPISGGTIKVSKSGGNYTFEFDIQSSSMNASVKGTYTGALSYIDATKQSAPARAPWANAANAPKRLVQYAAMQNVVDAQVSVINPLSFVKHAAVYEATISNVANIEKPLGLKKHFIKK